MKNFLVFTSNSEHLAKTIGKKPGIGEIVLPEKNKEGKRFFPDNEVYSRLAKIKKMKQGKVIVLHSGSPCPNDGLLELELILQILKDKSIKPEVFFAYFPYSQQDKVFQEGETNAAENLIKKLINYYGVKKIYGIDLHFWGRNWARKYPLENISAVPVLINAAEKDFGKNIVFLSPDKGGKRRSGISGLEKERVDSFEVKMASFFGDFEGKTVAIIDDIIETGGTLAKTYEEIKKAGAKNIIVLASHGILEKGAERIKKIVSKLYLANTINLKEANVDISGLIADAFLKRN